MLIPDVNLLLYAHIAAFPEHEASRVWWADVMNGDEPIGLPEAVVFGFIRVATNTRAFSRPLRVQDAVQCVEGWLLADATRVLVQVPESIEVAFDLLRGLGTAGNLTTDAQIAALAIHHDATLCSRDSISADLQGCDGAIPWRLPSDSTRR